MSKSITLCSSASFYKELLKVRDELVRMDWRVELPEVAEKMLQSGDFRVETYKTWFKNPADYTVKAKYVLSHFEKIKRTDAILVVNQPKNDIAGYIGGNVLMEMAVAFEHKKKIFILNPADKRLPLLEEVLALQPVFLNGDLAKIDA